jgi:hypothetical protein
MRKIKDEKKLRWCLRQFQDGKESEKYLAYHLGISTRRSRHLYSTYKQTGTLPQLKRAEDRKSVG